MKRIAIALILAGCGQQQTGSNESTLMGNSAYQVGGSPIATENGFARLVEAIADIECTAQADGQLIYAKSDQGFYYCDAALLTWTAIEVKGKDGKDGVDGTNGQDGLAGKDGENGQDGIAGKDGVDGAPAAEGIEFLGSYAHVDYAGAYKLNDNYNQTIQAMTLAISSDGSYTFSASVFVNGIVYTPTFWVSAEKKAISQVKNFKVVGSLNRLEFKFPSGQDMLTTVKKAVETQGDFGQSVIIGARLYTSGGSAAVPNFRNFTIIYEW